MYLFLTPGKPIMWVLSNSCFSVISDGGSIARPRRVAGWVDLPGLFLEGLLGIAVPGFMLEKEIAVFWFIKRSDFF